MAKYYLAVDIGASSGRLILGHLENGKMESFAGNLTDFSRKSKMALRNVKKSARFR